MNDHYDCLALFSGGLDSLLACKVIQSQGLRVLGLHFISPFFGNPEKINHWQEIHGLDIMPVDVGKDYVQMLHQGPKWGLGKCLNPCVDCKIFMLKLAKELLTKFQASFLITGEVIGQRPMSQRRDSMNIISREAGIKGHLLRPLCAKILPPTPVEESGLVDRKRLMAIQGRGRKPQLQLAEEFQLREIPTPAGGCLLTDPECATRFWPIFKHLSPPSSKDLELSKVGRQFWNGSKWLVIGRNKADNHNLLQLVRHGDIVFKMADVPGPIAIGRQLDQEWGFDTIEDAARFILRFSPKARKAARPVRFKIKSGHHLHDLFIHPGNGQQLAWQEPSWQDFLKEKKELFSSQAQSQ